jgi:predicted RNA-binding Zn ribbon-like protein
MGLSTVIITKSKRNQQGGSNKAISSSDANKFLFLANQPGLDFINTRLVKKQGTVDLLESPQDLLLWMFAGYLISAPDYAFAEQNWLRRPAMTKALADAQRLRRALELAVEALIDGESDPAQCSEALAIINECMAVPAVVSRLSRDNNEWRLQDYPAAPEGLVPLIVRQAARIFTDLDRRLIKKCRNDKCILYFYDTSKNQARAWCSMDLCGNRAKAAKHYLREMPG